MNGLLKQAKIMHAEERTNSDRLFKENAELRKEKEELEERVEELKLSMNVEEINALDER